MSFLPDCYFELIKQPGFEKAIVAGGFIRDSIMGGPISDLDIFVPVDDQAHFQRLVQFPNVSFEINSDLITKDSYSFNPAFVGKVDAKAGELEVDICGYRYTPNENGFASYLLDHFHYDIDRGYSTGEDPIVTSDQQKDIKMNTATLSYINESQPNSILHSFKKWERLKTKYPKLSFNNELQIKSRGNNYYDFM